MASTSRATSRKPSLAAQNTRKIVPATKHDALANPPVVCDTPPLCGGAVSGEVLSAPFTASCPVCAVMLVNCNEEECSEHVMRCLSERKVTEPTATTSEQVLCPCCEKVSLKPSELERHVQTCGLDQGTLPGPIPTLTAALTIRSSLGSNLSSTLNGTTGKRKRQNCITMRALKKLDEETQVALALSVSLQPDNIPRNRRAAAKSSRITLKFAPPPPMLIERDPTDSSRIVADRVAALVGKSRPLTSQNRPVLPESKLSHPTPSTQLVAEDDGVRSQENMWSLSERLLVKEMRSFYVSALVPPLSPCKDDADGHFRSLSQIPGFRLELAARTKDTVEKADILPSSLDQGFAAWNPSEVKPYCSVDEKNHLPCLEAVDSGAPGVPRVSRETSSSVAQFLHTGPLSSNPIGTPGDAVREDNVETDDENEDARTLILFSSSEDESDD